MRVLYRLSRARLSPTNPKAILMARDRTTRDDDDEDDRPRRARRPRDDDEDDEDDRPRSARRKPKADNTVKVLLILGGVLVVVVLICAGVGLTIYKSIARGVDDARSKTQVDFNKLAEENMKQHNKNVDKMLDDQQQRQQKAANADKVKATEAAAAFMQEVKGGRGAAAYRMTSAEFRGRTSEAAFEAMVRDNAPALAKSVAPHADIFAPESGSTYAFSIWAAFQTVNVTAIKQDGKWVIDVFTVTGR